MLGKYVIVRTYSAGVHAGILQAQEGQQVRLQDSRRIWWWSGAASLSELSQRGIKPGHEDQCKVPMAVPELLLLEAIEIIPCTESAEKSIRELPEWRA